MGAVTAGCGPSLSAAECDIAEDESGEYRQCQYDGPCGPAGSGHDPADATPPRLVVISLAETFHVGLLELRFVTVHYDFPPVRPQNNQSLRDTPLVSMSSR